MRSIERGQKESTLKVKGSLVMKNWEPVIQAFFFFL